MTQDSKTTRARKSGKTGILSPSSGLTRTERLLFDISTYLRISTISVAQTKAELLVDSLERAEVYTRLDGMKSQLQIKIETKIPQQTISDWIKELVRAGLVVPPNEFNQHHKAIFSLEELGLSVGPLKGRDDRKRDLKTKAHVLPTSSQQTIEKTRDET